MRREAAPIAHLTAPRSVCVLGILRFKPRNQHLSERSYVLPVLPAIRHRNGQERTTGQLNGTRQAARVHVESHANSLAECSAGQSCPRANRPSPWRDTNRGRVDIREVTHRLLTDVKGERTGHGTAQFDLTPRTNLRPPVARTKPAFMAAFPQCQR